MRIIHFSDIHLGRWPRGLGALFDKRVLGAVNFFLRRRHGMDPAVIESAWARVRDLAPDWLVCTGDLTCVGSPEEFALALDALERFRALTPGRFVYVPGNHDAYVRATGCRAALAAVFERLNGVPLSADRGPREIDLEAVSLLALDQACPTHAFRSSGRLSETAGAALTAWLARPRTSGKKRVAVGHFPVRNAQGHALGWRRSLREWALLDRALRAGMLDVYLCGHDHKPFVWDPGGGGGIQVCAGSLTASGRLNVLDIAPGTGDLNQSWVDVRAAAQDC